MPLEDHINFEALDLLEPEGCIRDDIRAAKIAIEVHKLRISFEASRGAKVDTRLPTLRDMLPLPLDVIEERELGTDYAADKVREQSAAAAEAAAQWMKERREAREKANASQSGTTGTGLPGEPCTVPGGPEQVGSSD